MTDAFLSVLSIYSCFYLIIIIIIHKFSIALFPAEGRLYTTASVSLCAVCIQLRLSLWAIYIQLRLFLCAVYIQLRLSLCAVYIQVRLSLCAVYIQLRLSLCAVYIQVCLFLCAVYIQLRLSLCVLANAAASVSVCYLLGGSVQLVCTSECPL